jgi:hypothetical protein
LAHPATLPRRRSTHNRRSKVKVLGGGEQGWLGPLAAFGADLGGGLELHQRLRQGADALTEEVHVGAVGLAQQLVQLHLGHDHRAPPERVD